MKLFKRINKYSIGIKYNKETKLLPMEVSKRDIRKFPSLELQKNIVGYIATVIKKEIEISNNQKKERNLKIEKQIKKFPGKAEKEEIFTFEKLEILFITKLN